MRFTPSANLLFRPEEEHVASREDDVVPPLGRRYETVEEPVGGLGTVESYVQVQGLAGLLASGVNGRLPLQGRWDTQRIPGAVREVANAAGFGFQP